MKGKRIFALTLTMLLIICSLFSNVYSLHSTSIGTRLSSVNLTVGSVQGSPGQTVTVPVNLKGVPAKGINNCNFRLSFDSSVFKIDSVNSGSIIKDPTSDLYTYTGDDLITFLFNDSSQGSRKIATDGLFAKLNLKIMSGAAQGTYKIKVTDAEFADNDLTILDSEFSAGTVTVLNSNSPVPSQPSSPKPQDKKIDVVIGSAEAEEGQIVKIPVSFGSVPAEGLNNCDFRLSYNANAFEIVSIDYGSIVVNPEYNFSTNTNSAGYISFFYNDSTQGANPIKTSGVFANINLKVKSGANGDYQIKLVGEGSFADNDLDTVKATFNEGKIKVKSISKPQDMKVEIGSTEGISGEVVTVPVTFQGVPAEGLNNCDFRLAYDSRVFDILSVDPGSIVTNPEYNFSANTANAGFISFFYTDSTQGSNSIKTDGLFANIKLKIKANAGGGNYAIGLVGYGSFADNNLETVNALFNEGKIKVTAPKPQSMNVEIGSAEGFPGQNVTIPVTFKGVPANGLNNCDFKLAYDVNVFETVSVDAGSIVANSKDNFTYFTGNPGYILLLYNDQTQGSNSIKADGLFANVNLKVKNGAASGNYQIVVSSTGEFADVNLSIVDVAYGKGSVKVLKSDIPSPSPVNMNVAIGSVQGLPGQTVTVPVNFEGVPAEGINNCDFRLSYDEKTFELVSVNAGDIIARPANDFTVNTALKGNISLIYDDSTQGFNPIKSNGLFASISLKIKDDAKSGDYQVKLVSLGDFADKNLSPVNALFNTGVIKVNVAPSPSPSAQPKDINVVIGDAQGMGGQTVTIPVNFQGVPSTGINNCDFKLSYDASTFELVSVDCGAIVTDPSRNFHVNTDNAGTVALIFDDATQGSNSIKADGLFADVNLKIKDNAKSGNYQIKLVSLGDFADKNLSPVNALFNTGVVKVDVAPSPSAQPKDVNVVIGAAQGTEGQTVTIPVNFQGVPSTGINNCDFKLSYDANTFELVSVDYGAIVTDPSRNFHVNTDAAGTVALIFDDATQGSNPIKADGLFANVNLKIKTGAKAGDYQLKPVGIGSFADINLEDIKSSFEKGKITVAELPQSSDISIVMGDARGSAGQTITVPISLKNVPAMGIDCCDFKISYDSNVFDIVSIDAGDIVPNAVVNFGKYNGIAGSIAFLYNDVTQGSEFIKADGVFAYIALKVKSGATPGVYNVKVDYIGDFADKDLNTYDTTYTDSKVTIM